MPKYTVTVTIDLIFDVEADDEEEAEDIARNMEDSEMRAVADLIQYEYTVNE